MISVRFRGTPGTELTHSLVYPALPLAVWCHRRYIGRAKLRCASGAIIPGALSILQGTVPGRVRGSGHMVPTYFRRELRDRALQRPLRLRTFVLLISASNHRFRDPNTTVFLPIALQLSLRPSSRAMFGGTERCMTASASKGDL